jgi:plasmid stabilization system protein ParE
LTIERFVEEAFNKDRRIRYVGIVDEKLEVLASIMRPGVVSHTTDDIDRRLISVYTPLIVETVEKMQSHLGRMQAVTVRYEKVVILLYHSGKLIIVLGIEHDASMPFTTEIQDLERLIELELSLE